MKNISRIIFTIALFVVFQISNVIAQTPQAISYQAVARNLQGQILAEQAVNMRISILQGTATGTAVYVETHALTTNKFGLITLQIGKGTVVSGSFVAINWGASKYFTKMEMDETGGVNYKEIGTSEMLAVPYSLHAKTAESVLNDKVDDADADPANEIQTLSITNNQLSISKGNTVTLPSSTQTGSQIQVLTETQILALTPKSGEMVYNSTANNLFVFDGTKWNQIQSTCFPEPSDANAGVDILVNDNNYSVVLSANQPIANRESGKWTIISGAGGSFTNDALSNTTFTGTACTEYTLRWTIKTVCKEKSDDVVISFKPQPTDPNAGSYLNTNDGTASVQLSANQPIIGTGEWSVVSGDGGSFANKTQPNTTFSGTLHSTYTIRWTITTTCGLSQSHDAVITFRKYTTAGNITDMDGNTYKTVNIGTQQWMAEDLKVTKFNDGTAIASAVADPIWDMSTTPYYSGIMYNSAVISSSKNVCPTAWHIPSVDEVNILKNYVGAAYKIKSTTDGWGTAAYSQPPSNETGFNAIHHDSNGSYWWTSYSTTIKYLEITEQSPLISIQTYRRTNAIRCVKD